jgi:predicted deacylase
MPDNLALKYSFLKILTGSDLSRRRLPMMSAKKSSRPVLWLTACCHGDEVGGIVIIQEIFKKIRKYKLLKKGSVFTFPLMNPIGFETQSRKISFSEEDLNRSFPGNAKGSLGERLAEIIFSTITDTCPSLVIDLHNDWTRSIPYVLIDPTPGPGFEKVYRQCEKFAENTGLPIIRDTEVLQSSLSHCLLMRKIPSITLELGESFVINEKNIEFGVKTIENIFSYMKMMITPKESFQYSLPANLCGKILTYSSKPYSSTTGIIRFIAKPGDIIKKGQAIAKVYNTFGKLQETMKASDNGIVLGHCNSSVVFPGIPVMAFGII